MPRHLTFLLSLMCATSALVATGCRHKDQEVERKLGFDAFVPIYNRYIDTWLRTQQADTEKEITRVTTELATAEGDAKSALETKAQALRVDQTKWKFRLGLGDYLKFGTPSEIPSNLVWQNGMDQPEIGDPASKKGGVFRRFIPTFPPTIRPIGSNANNFFRGDLYDYIDLPLVNLHPETMEMIPGLAREWATSEDGRTIYFRLDPEARYSDGKPVKAKDFLITAYIQVSDNIVNPYSKQYYRENLAQIAMYDDLTISISLPEAKIYAPAVAGAITPSSPEFYSEYGPDYAERYQWRFPPTTGAYEVLPEDIINGVSITQTHVKNWWAKDRKYYKYRFNPDKLVHTVVRDESKAFELFRAGELDTFLITLPQYWYEKSEIDPVYKGYIERYTFYKRYPKLPRGLYLNVAKPPLNDLNVRIGIQYAMNWQKVIDVLFRGDFQRLNAFNEGYVTFSDPSIVARPFSIPLARAAFAKAGYTVEGRDGILTKPDGTRLSVSVSYPGMPQYDKIFAVLREEAKSCGFELRLDGLEDNVLYKKEMQKQHEMVIGSWLIQPPVPDFHQFLHSTNAIDEKGNLKPQTNNTFSWHRADTDALSEKVRTATTAEELKDAAWKLQHIMHDEAIFVPGYSVDFVRIGAWRWVKWPDCENTRFSPPIVYDPHEVFVFWVDDAVKAETQAARRSGKVFPEVTKTIEVYRVKPIETGEPPLEPEPATAHPTEPVMEDSEDP
ncbi:MAG: ABC transporter substrate-binding protein [Luteolibacter sp.]|uniref:ABC transporter substrate-binding protein n=1 Tax=Luteolibacter sp. TaxID=1962973 RepID=UPI00326583F7